METVTCEHGACGNAHEHSESHSMWAVLQKVTPAGYTYFQCEQGQDFRWVNYQHFHCCHGHMLAGMAACIEEHYGEEQMQAPGGATILHKLALQSGLICQQCQAPLTHQAYRFCLTQGLPWHRSDNSEHEHTMNWCCSLEHAKEQVLLVIKSIPEMR